MRSPPSFSTAGPASAAAARRRKREERGDGGEESGGKKRREGRGASAGAPPRDPALPPPEAGMLRGNPAAAPGLAPGSVEVLLWEVLDCKPSPSSSSASLVDWLRVAAEKLEAVWAACGAHGVSEVAVETQPPQATDEMHKTSYFLLGQAMAQTGAPHVRDGRTHVRSQFAGRKSELVRRESRASVQPLSASASATDAEEEAARRAGYERRKADAIADTWFLLCPPSLGGLGSVVGDEPWRRFFGSQAKKDDAADAFLHAVVAARSAHLASPSPPTTPAAPPENPTQPQRGKRKKAGGRERQDDAVVALGIDVGKVHLGVCIVRVVRRRRDA